MSSVTTGNMLVPASNANATSGNTTVQSSPQIISSSPTIPSEGLMSGSSNDTDITLLTFGPLSACVSIPTLERASAPVLSSASGNVQRQQVQAWLAGLPKTTWCTPFAWTLKPDYTAPLAALATFQDQITHMLPTPNTTTARNVRMLEAQPVGPGNATFFQPSEAGGSLLSAGSAARSLPSGLPVWMGVVLASVVLVHLVALLLHLGADLHVLFPSLATRGSKDAQAPPPSMPMAPINQSTATLVEPKDAPAADSKLADPPGYAAPVPLGGTVPGYGGVPVYTAPVQAPVVRACRSAKRVLVPLLLAAALAMVAVAVVLNSKFAAGSVAAPGPVAAASAAPASASSVATSVGLSTSLGSTGVQPTSVAATSTSAGRASQVVSFTAKPTVAAAATTEAMRDDGVSEAKATSSMTRLVRRQADFFPPAATTTSDAALRTTTTQTPPSSTSVTSVSLATSAASAPTSSVGTSDTPRTQVGSSSASTAPLAVSTAAAQRSSADAVSGTAAETPVLVLVRGPSMHRVWWVVMLDLMLWFVQRRRTRAQVALAKAHATLLPHNHVHS